jgi:hypothetical protein
MNHIDSHLPLALVVVVVDDVLGGSSLKKII